VEGGPKKRQPLVSEFLLLSDALYLQFLFTREAFC